MVKNKRNSKDNLSIFFEAGKSLTPEIHPDLKARILMDADRVNGARDVLKSRSWLDHALDCLKELGGFPSAVGFAASLAVGVCIGLYSPDWSDPLASVFQLDTFDEVDFNGSFFEINEIFEDI